MIKDPSDQTRNALEELYSLRQNLGGSKRGTVLFLKGRPNPDRTMAGSLQHGQAAQRIGLPSTSARKHRTNGPEANDALAIKPHHLMGHSTVSSTEMDWASSAVATHIADFRMTNGYGCDVQLVPSLTTPAMAAIAKTR